MNWIDAREGALKAFYGYAEQFTDAELLAQLSTVKRQQSVIRALSEIGVEVANRTYSMDGRGVSETEWVIFVEAAEKRTL